MSDGLEALLTEFAERIRAVLRKEMVDALLAGAGEPPPPTTKKRGPGRPPRAVSAPRRAKGGKRDPRVLEATVGKLHAAIKTKPGQRIEEISRQIGVTTRELALPAKKLIAAKKIRTTGTRRATKYFPK
jgi:hypothetical protein